MSEPDRSWLRSSPCRSQRNPSARELNSNPTHGRLTYSSPEKQNTFILSSALLAASACPAITPVLGRRLPGPLTMIFQGSGHVLLPFSNSSPSFYLSQVVVSYIATAGIAVLIVNVYYLAIYQPTEDPFRKADETPRPFRPNPVDVADAPNLLRCKLVLGVNGLDFSARTRLNGFFLKVFGSSLLLGILPLMLTRS